jgi:hypothetical protein
MQFDLLPLAPLVLLFNDYDDNFIAQCILVSEKRDGKYLDAECLAMAGKLLYENLQAAVTQEILFREPKLDDSIT